MWGWRIDGVVHEQQTIAGVMEHVHQIIGNLKTLDGKIQKVKVCTRCLKAGKITRAPRGQGAAVCLGVSHSPGERR